MTTFLWWLTELMLAFMLVSWVFSFSEAVKKPEFGMLHAVIYAALFIGLSMAIAGDALLRWAP